MRPIHFGSAALIAGLVTVTGLACTRASGPRTTPPPDPAPITCAAFNAAPISITVQPGAPLDSPIPGGHRIEFDAGAVTKTSSYEIGPGPNVAANDWAEISIVPVEDADTIFSADVFLEISYASCAPQNGVLKMRKEKPALGRVESLGGRNDANRRVLRALVPHLSLFSIAR